MTNPMVVLKSFFPSGGAESEVDFLDDVFILPSDYSDLIAPPNRCLHILVGKKGSGKSAVVNILARRSEKAGIPAILVSPKDMREYIVDYGSDLASLQLSYFNAIISLLCIKISEGIGGLVINEEQKKILAHAIGTKKRNRDYISRLCAVLTPIGAMVSGVDLSKLIPNFQPHTHGELLESIQYTLKQRDKIIYLCIDDTDHVVSSLDDDINNIWGMLLAAKWAAESMPNLKVIVTLRSEVWYRLQFDPAGARDQTDHFRSLIRQINPSPLNIQEILEKRLAAATRASCRPHRTDYEVFFDGDEVTLPQSTEKRKWATFLVTSSRLRPRDTVQLVNLLAEYSKKFKSANYYN